MTAYYADYVNGNDANNGLGPDASHATNKPWKTLAKALGASGIGSGDTLYLAPGVFRERVTVAMTSAVAETQVIGDPLNTRGFKTSGGVLVPPEPVIHTAWETNDTTAPSASASTLILSGRDYLTFKNIIFLAGTSGNAIQADTNTSTNITFQDCAFMGVGASNAILVTVTAAANTALNWTIRRCIFVQMRAQNVLQITPVRPSGADFDINFQIESSYFYNFGSGSIIVCTVSGANTFNPGGVDINKCTLLGAQGSGHSTGTNWSTTIPNTIYNSIVTGGGTALNANASGQITEDYNRLLAATARTNVTAGGNSISGNERPMLLEFGQSWLHGFRTLPALSPYLNGCGIDGFGNTSAPSTDIWNRLIPSGGESTSAFCGAMERHNTAVQETSVVDASGSALKIIGPGDHSEFWPVDPVSTTLSIKVRYDTNHGTGNKPQVVLQAQDNIGVAAETKTATVGADTWEVLTFSAFTPSAKGVVEIRLISRAAAGNGIAYFDTADVA